MQALLLVSVFVIATCGLVYELIAGALASYLLGDSITQFSTVIGTYLFAMGIGSFLSRYIQRSLLGYFVTIEFLIGFVGGTSAAILFLLFPYITHFRILLYALVGLVGVLVGCEIPLLMRILQSQLPFKELVARVFAFDYVGALLAAILFPIVLVPNLGLVRTGLLFGMFNIIVALLALRYFRRDSPWTQFHLATGLLLLAVLGVGFAESDRLVDFTESAQFGDRTVYAATSPYQRIVITQRDDDIRLYLNGNLQFSSRDEYRYHEALVHVGMQSLAHPRRALVLGGGDGLALRELLKYPSLESVTLVDLDPEVTKLFASHEKLVALNGNAFASPKVTRIHEDAFTWLGQNRDPFDFIVVDFPDPSNFSIGKLYSTVFFNRLKAALSESGLAVIQSTSPYFARRSFWCVDRTLRQVGLQTLPYHVYVPSFGEWGFLLAGKNEIPPPSRIEGEFRFLQTAVLPSLFRFPPDMEKVETEPNRLNSQVLVRYFDEEWGKALAQ